MATFAIGDIHGNRLALDDLLSRIEPEAQAGDTVVFLGDYIDRGPESRGCIDSILRLKASGRVNVVTMMGNHEEWLLDTMDDPTRHSWLIGMEGLTTVESYSPVAADTLRREASIAGQRLVHGSVALPYDVFLASMPPEHLAFFRELRVLHRTNGALFVHGGLDPSVATIEGQKIKHLIWGTSRFLRDYRGPETVIYGHWDNAQLDDEGWPHPAIGRSTSPTTPT